MLRQLSLLIALGAAACGGMETSPLGPGRSGPNQGPEENQAPEAGPVTAGQVKSIERFDNAPFLSVGHDPVVAVGPDGRVHRAAINEQTGWPEIGESGTEFPGRNRSDISSALAMVADSKGNLHATWTRGSDVLYAQLDPDTYTGDPVVIGRGQKPNLALGMGGRVVVSFVSFEDYELNIPPLVMVAEGQNGDFSSPVITQAEPKWGGEPGQAIVSVSSLAIDAQGDLHLVYAWRARGRTVVEYLRAVDGVWSPDVRIADAESSPYPNIAVDNDGTAHIVYLTENTTHVMAVRVRDGIVSEPYVLYIDAVNVDRAKLAIDSTNAVQLVVHSVFRGERDRLRYVARPQTRGTNFVDIAFHDEPQNLILTSGAGGMVIGPNGKLYVPFIRRQLSRSDTGTLELATGIEVTRK